MREKSHLREILLTLLNSPSSLHHFAMANSLPASAAATVEEATGTRLPSNLCPVSFISCFRPLIFLFDCFRVNAWMSSPYVFELWVEAPLRTYFMASRGDTFFGYFYACAQVISSDLRLENLIFLYMLGEMQPKFSLTSSFPVVTLSTRPFNPRSYMDIWETLILQCRLGLRSFIRSC